MRPEHTQKGALREQIASQSAAQHDENAEFVRYGKSTVDFNDEASSLRAEVSGEGVEEKFWHGGVLFFSSTSS